MHIPTRIHFKAGDRVDLDHFPADETRGAFSVVTVGDGRREVTMFFDSAIGAARVAAALISALDVPADKPEEAA